MKLDFLINGMSAPGANSRSALTHFSHPTRILIAGRSTSGKTTLAVQLVTRHMLRGLRRCYAVCPTFYSQPALKPLRLIKGGFQHKDVFLDPSNEAFDYVLEQQRAYRTPALLFVDDAAADSCTNAGSKGSFARLCIMAPHLNLTIVSIFQALKQCTLAMRTNCEILVSFQPNGVREVECILEEFNPFPSAVDSKKRVKAMLTQAWTQYRYAIIIKTAFHPLFNPMPRMKFYAGTQHEICDVT